MRAVLFALVLMVTATATAHEHVDVRRFVIKSQLAQAGDKSIVFIGDSITESALFPAEICGHRVVNAGIGGASAGLYLDVLKGMPRFTAATIVIALGTNDARKGFDLLRFERDYLQLLDILRAYSSNIVLAGIPPIETGSLSSEFNESDPVQVNAIISEIAKRNELRFIDFRAAMNGERVTVDGVHPSPSGYRLWLSAIKICP